MDTIKSLLQSGTLYLPESISNTSKQFDALFYVIFFLSLVFFIGLIALSVYFIVEGKRGPKRQKATKQIIHNVKLEAIWTIIPTIIVMIIFVWGFKEYLRTRVVPNNAIEIYVSGKKWFWEFTYPNGKKTIDELVVPLGQPIKLIMSSTDVLHSFFIPNLRTKKDVIPNRYTVLWFQVDKPGKYHVFCTEYCGDGHSVMNATLEALDIDGYMAFLKKKDFKKDAPLNEIGKQLYSKKGCNACHSVDGTKMIGPTWKGLYNKNRAFTDGSSTTVNETYLKESILTPQKKIVTGYQPVMPSYQGLLEDIEINAIIEYIKELKK
jgi:cytochrome c oxidase subunit II